ncbi:hypothetical protein B296_00053093 [Ensete ventricosum]|uniref:Uncharacterized protein n=1 Tax=Ensete ventricosum TaxID=4639 RepID=A0A426Y9N7_ENSVE|nr:hypothetical protein B296_00053093 [Ensete ventricosum]
MRTREHLFVCCIKQRNRTATGTSTDLLAQQRLDLIRHCTQQHLLDPKQPEDGESGSRGDSFVLKRHGLAFHSCCKHGGYLCRKVNSDIRA